jgi:non-specific serine/threonine protein kinase
MWRRLGNRAGLGGALFILGSSPGTADDHAAAGPILEESAAIFRDLGDPWARARPLLTLGINALQRGDHADAQRRLEEALATCREMEDHWYAARALSGLGRIALANQDHAMAAARYREALLEYQRRADWAGVADCLEGLAAAHSADALLGVRVLGAVDALRERTGVRLDPVDRVVFDQSVASVRAGLAGHVFAEQWERGHVERTEAIVDELLSSVELSGLLMLTPVRGRGRRVSAGDALTVREQQVAGLIAQGYTNRRLAAALGITERTAEVHARNIREKLGFTARAQIAAWAVEHGLYRTSPRD